MEPFTDAPSDATIDPAQAAGSNTFAGTVVSSGTYTGDTNKTYALKITSAGFTGRSDVQILNGRRQNMEHECPRPRPDHAGQRHHQPGRRRDPHI